MTTDDEGARVESVGPGTVSLDFARGGYECAFVELCSHLPIEELGRRLTVRLASRMSGECPDITSNALGLDRPGAAVWRIRAVPREIERP